VSISGGHFFLSRNPPFDKRLSLVDTRHVVGTLCF
jgi:hypothetical protein